MLLRLLCLPLNISQLQKVSARATRLRECGSRAARSDVLGRCRSGQSTAEAEAEPALRSCRCFLAIPHLSSSTNRLSELTSPWEQPTASLIHISVLFPDIPVISSSTREEVRAGSAFSSSRQVTYAPVNCSNCTGHEQKRERPHGGDHCTPDEDGGKRNGSTGSDRCPARLFILVTPLSEPGCRRVMSNPVRPATDCLSLNDRIVESIYTQGQINFSHFVPCVPALSLSLSRTAHQ